MTESQLFSVRFAHEHILHMLMIGSPKIGTPFFQTVELVPLQGLDERLSLGTARSLNGFENLRHSRISQVTAGCRRMLVLVNHALDEPS